MKTYLLSDTHLKHEAMKTYCLRPSNFTELTHKNVMNTLKPEDLLLHLGDVGIGKYEDWEWMVRTWPCKKVLVRGNHDRNHSCGWWMDHGFDFVCDSMIYRGVWLTHEPAKALPDGTQFNVHGHLHNIWHGFHKTAAAGSPEAEAWKTQRLQNAWQRLFALEYTKYMPVEFDKFLAKPDTYLARGPKKELDKSENV